jgi:hypothetical protein
MQAVSPNGRLFGSVACSMPDLSNKGIGLAFLYSTRDVNRALVLFAIWTIRAQHGRPDCSS